MLIIVSPLSRFDLVELPWFDCQFWYLGAVGSGKIQVTILPIWVVGWMVEGSYTVKPEKMFQFEGFLCGELVSALNKYKDLLSLKNALQKAKHFILGIELDLRVAFFHDDLDHSEGSH
jgi:hypothetical protein